MINMQLHLFQEMIREKKPDTYENTFRGGSVLSNVNECMYLFSILIKTPFGSFSLRISSVNVTKYTGNYGFGHFLKKSSIQNVIFYAATERYRNKPELWCRFPKV